MLMVSAQRKLRGAITRGNCVFCQHVLAVFVFLDKLAFFEQLDRFSSLVCGNVRVHLFGERLVVAVKAEHADKAANRQVTPMRIHHVLRVTQNMLFFGETDHLEGSLHLIEGGVALFGGFGLVELDESDEKFRFVLAKA